MKTFRSIAAGFFFAAIFAVSAFAQTTTPSTGKVVIVNTFAFGDEKNGIAKYITAKKTVDAEFKTVDADLQTMGTKLQALQKELQTLQSQANANPAVPINQTTVNTKVEEYEKMGREFKFKQEDAKARYERRSQIVLGPVTQDILKSLQNFAKQKGYSIILDAAKLDEAGIILAVGDDKADVTKEFVAFFNSRPPTTAAVK